MSCRARGLAGALIAMTMLAGVAHGEPAAGQHKRSLKVGKSTIWYFAHLPTDFEKKGKLPVILFLHGAGERGPADGSQLDRVKVHGPPKIVQKDKDFPFLVISPQCEKGKWWNIAQLHALLDHVLKTYPADADRVYLTGLSMGGYGTWAMAVSRPERFAAIVPICGGGKPDDACRLKDLPTWVFHGDKDRAVPLAMSQAMVDAMKKCGDDVPVKFTVYAGVGHDSWTRTYNNPELYQWMLRHKRRSVK